MQNREIASDESPDGGLSTLPMKRARRRWTESEKQAIVLECAEPGASVSAVAKKHSIPTNMLFAWRKQFETCALTIHDGGEPSRVDRYRRDLTEIDKLQRLQDITRGQLTEQIRRGQVTSYNASIAASNLVSGFAKLTTLRADLLDKLEHLESLEAEQVMTSDDVSLEVQREAEAMVVELVRADIARKGKLVNNWSAAAADA